MHLTLKKEATKPAAQNFLQQQAKFDNFLDCYNHERPHQALQMRCPGELYAPSTRQYRGLDELRYPFHDRTITVTQCGRLCWGKLKLNLSTVFAGQNVGIKQIADRIWLISFVQCDLRFFDDETCRLEPGQNPFQAKCYLCLRPPVPGYLSRRLKFNAAGRELDDEMTEPFSVAFKQKMVQRLTGNSAVSASQLARQTGVRQQNLSRWLQEARSLPIMADKPKPAAREWPVEQKARVLADGSKFNGAELTAYLEREGVKLADYERWRMALDEGGGVAAATTKRIRQLERELARKEKALAEAAALLVLKKSGDPVRGGRGRRHPRAERQVILELIADAQALGARLTPACRQHVRGRQPRSARTRAVLRQRHSDARQHDALDPAVAQRHPLLQSAARLRRQSVLRGAVSHAQAHASVSAAPVRQPRRRKPLGDSVRRLVQRHAPPQRDPVCDA
jgi:putative transposase